MAIVAETEAFRFAPSPNGRLHLGHALSALINEEAARRSKGRFLVRIEDVDQSRAKPELIAAILEDLDWLGITYELPALHQSERTEAYRAATDELARMGLVYPAFLGRRGIEACLKEMEQTGQNWPKNPDGTPLYPGPERHWSDAKRRSEMANGRPYALRLDMARCLEGLPGETFAWQEVDLADPSDPKTLSGDPSVWGDVILIPKETPASYHLSVAIDDDYQAITHIVRGLDLKPATVLHRLLQHLLGLREPIYTHHRLILDETGRKLSKSDGAESLHELRRNGMPAHEVRALLNVQSDFSA